MWAPPAEGPGARGEGARLEFRLTGRVFRREYRAWLRASRGWARPWVLLPASGLLALGAAVVFAGLWWRAAALLLLGVALISTALLPWVLPTGLANGVWRQVRRQPRAVVEVRGADVIVTAASEVALPARDVSAIRRRPGLRRVEFGDRVCLFVPDRPERGDPDAFLAALEAARAAPPAAAEAHGPWVRLRTPPLHQQVLRTYRLMARRLRFVATLGVVAAAAALFALLAALGLPLAREVAVLVVGLAGLTLALPAIQVLLSTRVGGASRGRGSAWTATEEGLVVEVAHGRSTIPWAALLPPRGGPGLVELRVGASSVALARADVVEGDLDALLAAVRARAGSG